MSRFYQALQQTERPGTTVSEKPALMPPAPVLPVEQVEHRDFLDVEPEPWTAVNIKAVPKAQSISSTAPAVVAVPETDLAPQDDPNWTPGYRTVSLEVDEKSPICAFFGKDPVAAEQYRMVRTHLLQLPSRPRCVVISSASSGDGKTVTAINLAGTMAIKSDERVLLIDADMRKPGLSKRLGLESEHGLADVLEGRVGLADAIVSVEQMPSLFVLPSGTSAANPAELLEGSEWPEMIATLRREFSSIIIDTTPVSAVADFRLVQQVTDGVLLVVRPDHTRRSALKQALDKEAGAKVLGVVVNSYQENFLWSARGEKSYYPNSSKEGKSGILGWFSKKMNGAR